MNFSRDIIRDIQKLIDLIISIPIYRDKIYIAPSGVQKERIKSDDLFVQTINDEDLELPPPEKK